jgi:DNA-binding transcriptional MerR regulator
MRVSELVARTGVPLASVKYYLREGLLPPGRATGATQAVYGEEHVRRLELIRVLLDVVGLSVQRTRTVLGVIDEPGDSVYEAIGRAVAALPPTAEPREDYPRARALLQRNGQVYDPGYAAVAQLERALEAADAAGIPYSDDHLDAYVRGLRIVAEADLAQVPRDSAAAATEYAVLGTAVGDPLVVALRRLAHQHAAASALGVPADASAPVNLAE